jgi:hypothetical protein
LPVVLSLTFVAMAEERYVPVAAGTELRIVNPSTEGLSVAIEVLGGESTRLDVEAGGTLHWTAPGGEGVLRIEGDAALQITAVSRRDGVRVSLPVVAAREVVDEAEIPRRSPWRSGVLAINPAGTTASVMVDDTLHAIAPRGALRVDEAAVVRAHAPLLLFACDVNEATGARIFTPIRTHATTRKRRAVRSATPAPAIQTVTLTPVRDNTLFESGTGGLSNGAGVHVFAGTTQSGARRRALVAFDVAGQIPPGSRITRATLTMRLSKTISGALPATLHRVTTNWGEGSSNAGAFSDGGGTTAANGDATWLHTFRPNSRWSTAGGDFEAAADANTSVGFEPGVWESAAMLARVQQWLDQPDTNFGWIVIGDESRDGTAKRFDSREIEPATLRPSLTIEFQR